MKHKFFERYLDNDLDDLYSFIIKLENSLLEGNFPGISKEDALLTMRSHNNVGTHYNLKYNIFQFHHKGIFDLLKSIKSMMVEACEYYGINFDEQKYYIHGWFNCDDKEPIHKITDRMLHDHTGGTGIPYFHGYYCINAEPSVTYYKINRETMFENINKNNRAILSETGHPHRKGFWSEDNKRVTIAYDVLSLNSNDLLSEDLNQHWIPLI